MYIRCVRAIVNLLFATQWLFLKWCNEVVADQLAYKLFFSHTLVDYFLGLTKRIELVCNEHGVIDVFWCFEVIHQLFASNASFCQYRDR